MNEKLRDLQRYLTMQIKETERLMLISQTIHDSVTADKWDAVLSAYKEVYKRLFG